MLAAKRKCPAHRRQWTIDGLLSKALRPDVVDGLLNAGDLSTMTGDDAALVAADIAFAVTLGENFADRETAQGFVMFLAADDNGTLTTIAAQTERHHAKRPSLAIGVGPIDNPADPSRALAVMTEIAKTRGPCRLVVIDLDVLKGHDLDDIHIVSDLIAAFVEPLQAAGAHVMLVGRECPILLRFPADVSLQADNGSIVTDTPGAPAIRYRIEQVTVIVDENEVTSAPVVVTYRERLRIV